MIKLKKLKNLKKGWLNPFDSYSLFMGLTLHFNTSSKYNIVTSGKFRGSKTQYVKCKNKLFFDSVSTKFNAIRLYVSFLDCIINKNIRNSFELQAIELEYSEFLRKIANIHLIFEDDIKSIFELINKKGIIFSKLFSFKDGHPIIFQMLLGGAIEIESFLILDSALNLIDLFDKNMNNDFVWKVERKKLIAYRELLNYDDELIKTTVNKLIRKYKNCN